MIGGERKMRCMSLVVILLLSSPARADDTEKIFGNWRLVSFFSEDIQTKEHSNPYGEHPNGFIGFTPGRFFAFVTAEAVARHKLRKNRRPPFAPSLRIRENGGWTVRSSLPKWTQPGTPDGWARNRFVSGDWKEASYPLRLLPSRYPTQMAPRKW